MTHKYNFEQEQKTLIDKLYDELKGNIRQISLETKFNYHDIRSYLSDQGLKGKGKSQPQFDQEIKSELENKLIELYDKYEGDYEKVARTLKVTNGAVVHYLQDKGYLPKNEKKSTKKNVPYKNTTSIPKRKY